jgi:hypothetical protein
LCICRAISHVANNKATCDEAAVSGALKILQWARENGWQMANGYGFDMASPFAICHIHLPFAICHLPFAICHLPFAICHIGAKKAPAYLRTCSMEYKYMCSGG